MSYSTDPPAMLFLITTSAQSIVAGEEAEEPVAVAAQAEIDTCGIRVIAPLFFAGVSRASAA